MQIVQTSVPFSVNYTAFDQSPDLFVAFNVYDVTTGSAVFVEQVLGIYAAFGAYTAMYAGATGKTYLIIGLSYTDNTYLDPDLNRSPDSSVWQVAGNSVLYLGVDYAAYDQDDTLSLQGSVYNLTTGTPVFVQTIVMSHVAFGVYFGSFTGTLNNTYEISGVVYTDGSHSIVDTDRSPSCEGFSCILLVNRYVTNDFVEGTLIGQSLSAILVGE